MPDMQFPAPDTGGDETDLTVATLTVESLTGLRPVSTDEDKLLVSGAAWTYAAASDETITIKVSGDTNARFTLKADGTMAWGPGNGAADTVLARSGTASLVAGASASEGVRIRLDGSVAYVEAIGALPGRTMVVGNNSSNRNLEFMTEGFTVWTMGSILGGGDAFYPADDNTADIGISGTNRPRSIYWATQAIGPVGAVATPSYTFTGDLTTGIFRRTAGAVTISTANADRVEFRTNLVGLGSGMSLSWGDATTITSTSSFDVNLVRDAAGVLALRNSTTAQEMRVYNTHTSSTNYETIRFLWSGNVGYVVTDKGSVGGTIRDLSIGPNAAGASLNLIANTVRWTVTTDGHFLTALNNTYDIGADGATSPRSIYVGTHIKIAGDSGGASIRVPNATAMRTGSAGTSYYFDLGNVFVRDGDGSVLGGSITVYSHLSIAGEVFLYSGGANILEQRNTTNAQTFRVYGTTTGPKYIQVSHDGTDAYCITNSGRLGLGPSSTVPWLIQTTGHFFANGDNTYDFGASGASRPRSLYWGTQALGPNGSASAPTYSFALTGNDGMYSEGGGDISFSISGARNFIMQGGTFYLRQDVSSVAFGASADGVLTRIAANTLGMQNGVSGQEWRVYGSTTGPVYVALSHSGSSASIGTNSGGGSLHLVTGGSSRWLVGGTTGHITANTNNTYDFGATSNMARSIYFGTQAIGPVGSASAPTYTFTGSLTTGFYSWSVNCIAVTCAGTVITEWDSSGQYLKSTVGFGWSSGDPTVSAADVILNRDAAGVLAQKNGANAQKFRAYGTTTGPKYVEFGHDATDGYVDVTSGSSFWVKINGTIQWGATTSAWSPAATDNSLDFATSGNRARSGFFGTSVSVGTNPASAGGYRIEYANGLVARNQANSGNITLVESGSINGIHNIVTFGTGSNGMLGVARSGGAPPTTSDLPAGHWTVWRDTGGGTTKVYYNNAGAIIASAAFS